MKILQAYLSLAMRTDWNNDTCGHGSHVAGTIAASFNDFGVVGVNPGGVSLHIVKVFDGPECGWSYSSTLANAANICQAAGADIISMSLGGAQKNKQEERAFNSLYSAGILSIAAAGNDGTTAYNYPASYSSVVSVAAIDSRYELGRLLPIQQPGRTGSPRCECVKYCAISQQSVRHCCRRHL